MRVAAILTVLFGAWRAAPAGAVSTPKGVTEVPGPLANSALAGAGNSDAASNPLAITGAGVEDAAAALTISIAADIGDVSLSLPPSEARIAGQHPPTLPSAAPDARRAAPSDSPPPVQAPPTGEPGSPPAEPTVFPGNGAANELPSVQTVRPSNTGSVDARTTAAAMDGARRPGKEISWAEMVHDPDLEPEPANAVQMAYAAGYRRAARRIASDLESRPAFATDAEFFSWWVSIQEDMGDYIRWKGHPPGKIREQISPEQRRLRDRDLASARAAYNEARRLHRAGAPEREVLAQVWGAYYDMVHAMPFMTANNSMFMNFVNRWLERLGREPIPHGHLDAQAGAVGIRVPRERFVRERLEQSDPFYRPGDILRLFGLE